MKTRVIIMVQDTDSYNKQLSNEFYNFTGELDEFVSMIRKRYPQAVCPEPIEEDEVQGEVVDRHNGYLMTCESHNIGETMRIYETAMDSEKIFKLFDVINRSGVDNGQWGVVRDVQDTKQEFGTIHSHRLDGKWLYVYTDDEGVNPLSSWSKEPEPDRVWDLEQEMFPKGKILLYRLEY